MTATQRWMATSAVGPWWRSAIVYQVFVRSFADTDGDGIGDLPGVRSRLDYIRDLGVDAVWLTPFYPSPHVDAGYDVADHRQVDPLFGTLADVDGLVGDAHELGLRVIVDLVPNHTSDQHPWFQAALRSGPGSPERARYLFRDGRGPTGDDPPNDWVSLFGGAAWSRVPEIDGRLGQWYLHLFTPEQPDLDWMNHEVRAEFESILRYWLDRGIDGFRIDVAHGLAKDPDLRDLEEHASGPVAEGHPHWDLDEVHDVYRSWRSIIDAYPQDPAFVGEVGIENLRRLARYLRTDELHTAFNFNLMVAPWDATVVRGVIDETINLLGEVGAPPTWVLSNHDSVRPITRHGGGLLGVRRARAAALLMFALPGGAYVYQGEELGLAEITDLPDDARQDPVFHRSGGSELGRDGCRVPLPWSGHEPPFGFGPHHGVAPWLPQPHDWGSLTAERQARDPTSMLTLYRDALRLRRAHPALGEGTLHWFDTGVRDVLAFRRDPGFVCLVNFAESPAELPVALTTARVLLASASLDHDDRVPGTTVVWFGLD